MMQNLIRLFLKKKQFLPHTPLTVFLSILLELVLVKNLKWLLQKQKVKPQQFQLPDHFWKFQQGVLHFIWMLGKTEDARFSILSWNINQGIVNFYSKPENFGALDQLFEFPSYFMHTKIFLSSLVCRWVINGFTNPGEVSEKMLLWCHKNAKQMWIQIHSVELQNFLVLKRIQHQLLQTLEVNFWTSYLLSNIFFHLL